MRGKLVFAGVALGLSISAQAQDIPDVKRAQFVAQMDADFVQLDANGDGAITLIEYRVATQASFDSIDADRNGTITASEMRGAGIVR